MMIFSQFFFSIVFQTLLLLTDFYKSSDNDEINKKDFTSSIDVTHMTFQHMNDSINFDEEPESPQTTENPQAATEVTETERRQQQDVNEYLDFSRPIPYYELVNRYLVIMGKQFPKTSRRVAIGESEKGNTIYAMEISHSIHYGGTVIIDAGMHGNEWISVSVASYLINQLVQHVNRHIVMVYGLKYCIITVANPDGYIYALEKNKTYNLNLNNDAKCPGVNLARNFDIGDFIPSKNCTVYPGSSFFSEKESRSLKKYMESQKDVKLYINLHGGESAVAYPYAFKDIPTVPTADKEMTANMRNVISYYDHKAIVKLNSLIKLKGMYSGSPTDWAADRMSVPFSIYLSMRDPPASEVDVVLRSALEAIKWAVLQIQLTDSNVAEALYNECVG